MKEESKSTRFDFIESDKRIIDQKLRKHSLPQAELQKMVKSLSDEKDKSDELVVYKEAESHS